MTVMAEESRQTVVDGPAAAHPAARRTGWTESSAAGIDVLDVACGSGAADGRRWPRRYPASRFTGVDMSSEAITAGRAEADRARRSQRDAWSQARRRRAVARRQLSTWSRRSTRSTTRRSRTRCSNASIAALRPGGMFLMQDIAGHTHARRQPRPPARAVHVHDLVHALHVGVAGGRRAGPGRDVGPREGGGDAQRRRLRHVRVETLPHDPINYYYIAVKQS